MRAFPPPMADNGANARQLISSKMRMLARTFVSCRSECKAALYDNGSGVCKTVAFIEEEEEEGE